jgi:hypothetical protein
MKAFDENKSSPKTKTGYSKALDYLESMRDRHYTSTHSLCA